MNIQASIVVEFVVHLCSLAMAPLGTTAIPLDGLSHPKLPRPKCRPNSDTYTSYHGICRRYVEVLASRCAQCIAIVVTTRIPRNLPNQTQQSGICTQVLDIKSQPKLSTFSFKPISFRKKRDKSFRALSRKKGKTSILIRQRRKREKRRKPKQNDAIQTSTIAPSTPQKGLWSGARRRRPRR
jgi:hypothetical protein